MDRSPPGSSVHGILQARMLEWVAGPSSKGSSRPRDRIRVLKSPALAGGFFTKSLYVVMNLLSSTRQSYCNIQFEDRKWTEFPWEFVKPLILALMPVCLSHLLLQEANKSNTPPFSPSLNRRKHGLAFFFLSIGPFGHDLWPTINTIWCGQRGPKLSKIRGEWGSRLAKEQLVHLGWGGLPRNHGHGEVFPRTRGRGEEGQSQGCYSKTVIYSHWYGALNSSPKWTSNVLKRTLNCQVLAGPAPWFSGVSLTGPQPTLPRHSPCVVSSGIRESYIVDRILWRPRKMGHVKIT